MASEDKDPIEAKREHDGTLSINDQIQVKIELDGYDKDSEGEDKDVATKDTKVAAGPLYSAGPNGCNCSVACELTVREDARDQIMALKTVLELVSDMFVRDFLAKDLLPSPSTKEWYNNNADKLVVVELLSPVSRTSMFHRVSK